MKRYALALLAGVAGLATTQAMADPYKGGGGIFKDGQTPRNLLVGTGREFHRVSNNVKADPAR